VVTGAALWVVTLVPGGYFFGHIPVVRDHLTSIVLLGVGLGVGALVVSGTWRYFNSRNVDWKEVGK
jgi:membrane-associated protein